MKPAHEQLVVFSILLPEEKYINELSDPSTEEYQQLSQQFISEVIILPIYFCHTLYELLLWVGDQER